MPLFDGFNNFTSPQKKRFDSSAELEPMRSIFANVEQSQTPALRPNACCSGGSAAQLSSKTL
jgi:hypothetical protein